MNDFQLLLAELQNAYRKQLPFVAYRKPHENHVKTIVQQSKVLHYMTDHKQAGFVFAPFNLEEKIIIIPLADATAKEVQFNETSSDVPNKPLKATNSQDKIKHLDLVKAAVNFVESGQVNKVVASRKETLEQADFSFYDTFNGLLKNYKNAFVYIWYHPQVGLWLGATPELLLRMSDTTIKTVSLAGTQAFTKIGKVTWGAKELEEQQIVTDYIANQLKPYVDSISISDAQTIKAGNVVHLSSEINGIIKREDDVLSLIKSIHPTPAVCGVPKENAKRFILDREGYDREFYTGFLGEIHIDKSIDLYVNLRCMKYEAPYVSLFLGGGITKDSDAENEWNETVEKSKVIKKVL